MSEDYHLPICTCCYSVRVEPQRAKALRPTCMDCGEKLAKQRKFTVACNNKQGYELITDPSHLRQLNPKRTT
jgi:transposase-like protein